jgi:predicted nucleotidyltransferase
MSSLLEPLDAILTSRSKVRLLRVMISTDQPLSGREAARLARVARVPAARSLDDLVTLRVLHRQTTAAQHLYTLNRENFLVEHGLQPLYGTEQQRVGRVFQRLRTLLESAPSGVLGAWIFGSAARGADTPESDLDLLVAVEQTAAEQAVHGHLMAASPELHEMFGLRLSPVVIAQEPLRTMYAEQHPLTRDALEHHRRVMGADLDRILH